MKTEYESVRFELQEGSMGYVCKRKGQGCGADLGRVHGHYSGSEWIFRMWHGGIIRANNLRDIASFLDQLNGEEKEVNRVGSKQTKRSNDNDR